MILLLLLFDFVLRMLNACGFLYIIFVFHSRLFSFSVFVLMSNAPRILLIVMWSLSLDQIETNINSHFVNAARMPCAECERQRDTEEHRKYLPMNNIRYAILKTHYVASKPSPLAFSKKRRRRALPRDASEWEGEREMRQICL